MAKIYFTNGNDYKLRPILIIKVNSFGDLIYIPFTTNSNNINTLKFDNNFLQNGEFRKQSYLIIDKTCTIQKTLLDRKIGTIKDPILDLVFERYCSFLKDATSTDANVGIAKNLR